MASIELVTPSSEHLPHYITALEQGWSADNMRPAATQEELERISENADAFLASMTNLEAKGGPIKLPDGSTVPRLPGFRRWIWDGEFCGSLGLRWQPGTNELPPYCLGHIGYAVVPWKQGRGYATQALALLLPEARAHGLKYVYVTTNTKNFISQKVILANGGILVETFEKPAIYGGGESWRYRIDL